MFWWCQKEPSFHGRKSISLRCLCGNTRSTSPIAYKQDINTCRNTPISNKILKTIASNLLTKAMQSLRTFLLLKKQKKGPPFCSTRFTQNRQSLTPISGEHGNNSKRLSMVFLESLDLPHPKLLEVISNMIDNPFRLSAEPIPVVTFS